jgi:nucleotide-binding universal stress UspA family protein
VVAERCADNSAGVRRIPRWPRRLSRSIRRGATVRGNVVAATIVSHRIDGLIKELAVIEIRQILCPTDFSEASRRALDHAVAIAKWYDSKLTILHVSPVQPVIAVGVGAAVIPPVFLTAEARQQLLTSMQKSAEAEVGQAVAFETELTEGNPVTEILDKAAALHADLLVLGTHGLSGFDRLVLGSVTEKVLRKAACPVMTVPPHQPDVVPVSTALFRRILCGVDFSECSLHALEYALSLAQEADAHLTVLNALERLFPPVGPGEADAVRDPALRGYFEMVEADHRMRLQQAVPDEAGRYCRIERRLEPGTAYREILRVAHEDKSDLIVLGVHGRGAIDRVLFGSTAQQVVRYATCPVLTLRQG